MTKTTRVKDGGYVGIRLKEANNEVWNIHDVTLVEEAGGRGPVSVCWTKRGEG